MKPTGQSARGFRLLPRSLRGRFLLILLAAVLPILGLVTFFAVEERRTREAEVRENALRVARIAALNQRQILQNTRQLLAGLAQDPHIQTLSLAPSEALLRAILRQLPQFGNIAIADLQGEVIASAVPLQGEASVAGQEFFRQVVATRRYAAGDYLFSPTIQRPVVAAGYPVTDAQGEMRAVIYAVLPVEIFNATAAEAQPPPGGVLTVIDRNGTIVARHPDPEPWVGRRFPDAEIVRLMLDRKEGVATARGLDGVEREYAFAEVDRSPEAHLYLNIGFTRAAFDQAGSLFAQTLLLALGIAIAAAAWWFGRRWVLEPISALAAGAGKLGAGDLATRVALSGGTEETTRLALAFNRMAASIQQREEHLQAANRALAESEERYRLIVDNVRDYAIFMLDPAGRVVTWNPGAEKVKGWRAGEILERHISAFYSAEDQRQHLPEQHLREAAQGSSAHYEGLRLRKDGSRFQADISLSAVRNAEGALRGFVKVVRDMTGQKRTEAQLRASEARFRALFESLPIGAMAVDLDTLRFVMSNPAAAQQLGYSMEEYARLRVTDLEAVHDEALIRANLQRLMRGEVRITARLEHEHLEVSVSDTGIGIKPEQRAQLFEAFRQVEGSAQRRFEGTGLGLYLSKQLVTMLGGEIYFENEFGRESRFTFAVPARPAETPRYETKHFAHRGQ